ncbi:hypothetical protein T4A_12516 [Trichinella pseudospiralis]|uniref:Uncharacterized protein n=1 Tax=Trichinella pseudospiralis TaxID=6337 RepID=A0A0V1DJP8_TRIPS|nr:hypothetical protein T4A_12516 [Trichinella pseudospiralis]
MSQSSVERELSETFKNTITYQHEGTKMKKTPNSENTFFAIFGKTTKSL